MPKYRKKPVVIEAVQFFESKKPWPDGVRLMAKSCKLVPSVVTLEGDMRVRDGDWVITGIKGEKYPCKPDIFEATYELVKDTDNDHD